MNDWMPGTARLFAAQRGLATTAQLRGLGVPDGVVRRRSTTGEWERPWRGLVALPAEWTWERRAMAALLLGRERAALSHAAAARLHRFDGYDRDERLALTSIERTHVARIVGVEVHRSRVLQKRHCIVLPSGFRAVIVPVALIQIASLDGRDAAAKALDGLLRDGVRPAWIGRVADEWREPGVSGPRSVSELLHERVDGRLPRSWFQRLAKLLLSTRGIELVDEWPVHTAGRRLADLDLAIPALKIGVECQSWAWHATPAAKDRDNRRRRRLRELGWDIIEVWWTDLDRIDEVARDIAVSVDRRRPALPGIA